jgi:predicted transcriptional regulator
METRTVSAEVPAQLADKIDEVAWQMNRPASWVLEQALAEWFSDDWRHRQTLEGLADVDAGRLVDQERVKAWAESLGTNTKLPPPAAN